MNTQQKATMAKIKKDFKYIYDLQDSIKTKIEKISKEIYGAI